MTGFSILGELYAIKTLESQFIQRSASKNNQTQCIPAKKTFSHVTQRRSCSWVLSHCVFCWDFLVENWGKYVMTTAAAVADFMIGF